jgi:hypothetical protein
MRKAVIILLPLLLTPLGGCVRTVASVATAPFKAAGQVVDWTTTSQDEADRNYGRKARKKEAREGRERREWAKHCRNAKDDPECGQYTRYQAASD